MVHLLEVNTPSAAESYGNIYSTAHWGSTV